MLPSLVCAPWSDFPYITYTNISNIILKFNIQITSGMTTLEGYGTVVQLKCSMAKISGLITCTTPCTLWFIYSVYLFQKDNLRKLHSLRGNNKNVGKSLQFALFVR